MHFSTLTEFNGPTVDIWYLFIHLFFSTRLEAEQVKWICQWNVQFSTSCNSCFCSFDFKKKPQQKQMNKILQSYNWVQVLPSEKVYKGRNNQWPYKIFMSDKPKESKKDLMELNSWIFSSRLWDEFVFTVFVLAINFKIGDFILTNDSRAFMTSLTRVNHTSAVTSCSL